MPRVRPAKFVHVVYRTRRFEPMIAWYQAVFDARVQYQNPALAFLTYDDEHHRFAFANLAVLQPEGSDLEARRDRRRSRGLHLPVAAGSAGPLQAAQGNGHPALLVRAPWHHRVDALRTATRWNSRSTASRPTTRPMPTCMARTSAPTRLASVSRRLAAAPGSRRAARRIPHPPDRPAGEGAPVRGSVSA